MPKHAIIIEEASLELVPQKFWKHESCKLVESRFGVAPEAQLLDDNFHHQILTKMPGFEKRGRPDIVHFALLDIISTPAYFEDLIQVYVHTIGNSTIKIKRGVRLPRTFQRFSGVMSKILSDVGEAKEKELFEFKQKQPIDDLLTETGAGKVVCLSSEGVLKNLVSFTKEVDSKEKSPIAWVIGGFPRGHFSEELKSLADEVISISEHPLAAHVVTARLCYSIEMARL